MQSRFMRASVRPGYVGLSLLIASCAPVAETETPATPVVATHTTTSSGAPALRIGEHRILSTAVNPQQPFDMVTEGDTVVITFVRRGLQGMKLVLDGAFLHRSARKFTLSDPPSSGPAAAVSSAPLFVSLKGERRLLCWVDQKTRGAMVQLVGGVGSPPLELSRPGNEVVGAIAAVTLDQEHVLVAFIETSEDGFNLVGTPLDAR